MADYLSTQPAENNGSEQTNKTEELWNIWFTFDDIFRHDKFVSANKMTHAKRNQPTGEKLTWFVTQ